MGTTGGVTECENLLAKVGFVDGRGVLDQKAASSIERGFQELLDCLPSKAILEFGVDELELDAVWRIDKPVTLKGGADSLFSIKCPEKPSDVGGFIQSQDVSLFNLEFTGCDFNSTRGLIHIESSKNVTVRDVRFTNITNHGGPCCMSVIESENVLIDQVTAEKNTGGSRGGVFSFQTKSRARILRSRFNQNNARGFGGAIYADMATVEISEASFEENKAGGRGGAVSASNSSRVRISSSEFLGNRVEEPEKEVNEKGDVEEQGLEGGAISIVNVKVVDIENSTFIRNRAPRGGAVLVNATSLTPSKVRVSGSTFRANKALDGGELSDGGAIYSTGIDCLVEASVFEKNEASDAGGAFFGRDLVGLNVSYSQFTENAYGDDGGGIILLESQNIFLHDTNFTGNYEKGGKSDNVHSGGAIHGWSVTDISLSKCHFTENRAMQGGALQIEAEKDADLPLEIKDCSFERNSVTGEEGLSFGGAIAFFGNKLRCTIQRSHFQENQNVMGSGGAIITFVSAKMNISDSKFVENSSHRYGGAIYSQVAPEDQEEKMNLHISNSSFVGNSGGQSGGALHVQGHVIAEILDSEMVGNIAEFDGGAIHNVNGSKLTFSRGLIDNNTAKNDGGGLWMGAANPHGSILSTVFSSNVGTLGGGIYVEDEADVDLKNCTFESNRAHVGGGALCAKHGDLNAFNTNVAQNSVVSIRDSNFSNNTAGELFAIDASSVLVKSVDGKGGALMLAGEGVEANITGSIFSQNSGGIGGAVYMNEVLQSKLENTIFEKGGAVMGGGLAVIDISKKIEGSGLTFVRNHARTGGGFSLTSGRVDLIESFVKSGVDDSKTVVFRDVLFEQNFASEGGGGVDLDMQRFNCSECLFIGNQVGTREASRGSGGGLQLRFSAVAQLVDSTIHSCSAGFGGGVYVNDAFFDGVNVTVVENSASSRGGGLATFFGSSFTTDQSLLMKCDRCSIDGNRAKRGGGMHVTVRPPSLPDCGALNRVDSLQSQREAFDISVQCKSDAHYPALLDERRVLLADTSFSRNTAKEAGLGMFITDLSVLRFCCGGECLDVENSTAPPRNCLLSESVAKCVGAVLTPLPSHWHASSRSADVHECLSDEACDYEGRTRILEEAGKQGELTFGQEEYPQCNLGYTGVLCGGCQPTHGKVNSSKCIRCNGRWRAATLIVFVLLVLVVLSIIFVKSSSRTVRGGATPVGDGGGGRVEEVATSRPQPVGVNMASYVAGEVLEIQPERCEASRKEPKTQGCEGEENARASDVLKVLVNFAQVTGAAAAVNANWRSSMLSLLTLLDMSSGVTDNNTLVAFECAFSDRGFSRAIKTNLVLISMPFIVWLVFVMYYAHRMWEKGYDLKYLRLRALVSILAVIHVSYIRSVTPESAKGWLSGAFIFIVVGFVLYMIKHIFQTALLDVVKLIQKERCDSTPLPTTTTAMLKLVTDYSSKKFTHAKSSFSEKIIKPSSSKLKEFISNWSAVVKRSRKNDQV
ncbi:hypothetical protein BSKO_10907 [Bryopsis sp. KO-2023]|nr:hypothetical protein BSKO_10907 [Bryopsis sp. KO-2023]